jgi:hypothetical protein
MGFFKSLFGLDIEYPMLDNSNPAARQLEEVRNKLEDLAEQIQAPMEVVPADGRALIFAGEPPKVFGIFMVDREQVGNLKELAENNDMSEEELARLTDHLRNAYLKRQQSPRFSTNIAKGKVTVIQSPDLINEVKNLVLES